MTAEMDMKAITPMATAAPKISGFLPTGDNSLPRDRSNQMLGPNTPLSSLREENK
jgi:hypothetical protein